MKTFWKEPETLLPKPQEKVRCYINPPMICSLLQDVAALNCTNLNACIPSKLHSNH